MKIMQKWSLTRILRMTVAMITVVSLLLLCGCGKKNEETQPVDKGLLLGDGDGRMEAQDFVDGTTTIYGNLLSAVTSDYGTGTGSQMETVVTLGDQLLSMLSMLMQQNGLDADITWLKQLGLTTTTVQNGQSTQTTIAAKLNGESILSADVIMDMAGGMTYIGLPELNSTYIGQEVDFTELQNAYYYILSNAGQYTQLLDQLPTEQELNALLSRYLQLMLSAMPESDKGSETLVYDNISQTLDTTTYTLTDTALYNMVNNVLTTAQTDGELEKMMDAFSQIYNQIGADLAAENGVVWNDADLHQRLLEEIENGLASMEEFRETLTQEALLKLVVYTDGGEQAGFALDVYNVVTHYEYDGTHLVPVFETVKCWAYTLRSGENTAFVMNVQDAFRITGTGTEVNDLANGHYSLSVENTEMLAIDVVNFDTKALAKAELKGTLRLTPSQEFMDQVVGSNLFFGSNLIVELVLDVTASGASIGTNLYNGSALLLGLSTTSREIAGAQIQLPSDYADAEDAAAMQAWAEGLNLDAVQQRLLAAGVPEDLINTLKEMLGS